MHGRQWLDQIERELIRRRLPRQDVARLLAELSEHLEDVMRFEQRSSAAPATAARDALSPLVLMEEPMSLDAHVAERLGSPVEIAESALHEFRQRSLLNRSRLAAFATFVLSPIPLVVVAWGLVFALVGLLASLVPESVVAAEKPRTVTTAEVLGVNALVLAVVIAPPILVAAFYGRLARRTLHRWHWGIAACLLVAVASSLATYQCTFSGEPGKSQVMLGVAAKMSFPTFTQIGQFVVPLACGLIVLRRSTSDPSPSQPPV
jgi:hypothetical protein